MDGNPETDWHSSGSTARSDTEAICPISRLPMKRRGGWRLVEDGRLPEVMKLHAAGKSTRAIATALDMGQSAVSRLIRKANQNGLAALNAKAGAESESVSQ